MNSNDAHEQSPIIADNNKNINERSELERNAVRIGVMFSTSEVVSRFGSADAEFLKGYNGVDKQTEQEFAKGLEKISTYKVNPEFEKSNLKQQAGFSAEVATTSRDNAKAIIDKSKIRTSRSDDLHQYGKNHNVVDRVQILNGEIIEGSQAQMKFVGNRDKLFQNITHKNGKFQRYRGIKLEIPSEQYEGAQDFCYEKARSLRQQAAKVEQIGKPDIAEEFRKEADNYDQLSNNLKDCGLTTEQALYYREYPAMATAFDIASTSHGAGLEGAKCAATIGLAISAIQSIFFVIQGERKAGDVAKDLALGTVKAGAIGYGNAFVGATVKAGMQQSGNQAMRTLSNTTVPTMIVNICLSLGSSVKRYATGEISEAQLLVEVGEKGAGMLSSGMMAAIGQVAIPIPFVGAAIGGMIGCTLSSIFYQSALDTAIDAEASRQNLDRVRAVQAAARFHIAEQQSELDALVRKEIPELLQQTHQLFSLINSTDSCNSDVFATGINQYATLLGKQLKFQSLAEFSDFMDSNDTLHL